MNTEASTSCVLNIFKWLSAYHCRADKHFLKGVLFCSGQIIIIIYIIIIILLLIGCWIRRRVITLITDWEHSCVISHIVFYYISFMFGNPNRYITQYLIRRFLCPCWVFISHLSRCQTGLPAAWSRLFYSLSISFISSIFPNTTLWKCP